MWNFKCNEGRINKEKGSLFRQRLAVRYGGYDIEAGQEKWGGGARCGEMQPALPSEWGKELAPCCTVELLGSPPTLCAFLKGQDWLSLAALLAKRPTSLRGGPAEGQRSLSPGGRDMAHLPCWRPRNLIEPCCSAPPPPDARWSLQHESDPRRCLCQ